MTRWISVGRWGMMFINRRFGYGLPVLTGEGIPGDTEVWKRVGLLAAWPPLAAPPFPVHARLPSLLSGAS